MKNMKFWRTALVATLVLTVMLSVTGGTIAWFTDTVTSGNNVITAGNLKAKLEYKNKASDAWTDASTKTIFDYDRWEPGYTDVKYVKVSNVGNLAFNFKVSVEGEAAVNEGAANLADVIDVYCGVGNAPDSSAELHALPSAGTVTELLADEDGVAYGKLLPATEEATAETPAGSVEMWIALHMKEEAGNAYQGKSVGSGFSVVLEATQLTYEQDSFGADYDGNAIYGEYGATHERIEMNVSAADAAGKFDMNQDVAVFMAPGRSDMTQMILNGEGNSDSDFALIGNNTEFTGNLNIGSHSNIRFSDDAVLTIDGITVNGTLKVTAYGKNIVVKNVKAKAINILNFGTVTIENCILDGAESNGLYVTPHVEDYDMTILNNIIKNSAKNAIQIAGNASGKAYGAGTVTVKGNTFENWCTLNDTPRAAFKVWGDSKITPDDLTNNNAPTLTKDAQNLINAIEAGNNTFTQGANNTNQVKYDLWGYTFNSLSE